MKKFFIFLFSFLPMIVSCTSSLGGGKVNVTSSGEHVTFSETSNQINKNKDYTVEVKPEDGYVLTEYCFEITIGEYQYYVNPTKPQKSNVFTFENNILTINGLYVVRDIKIYAQAREVGDEGYYVTTSGNNVSFNPVTGSANSNENYTLKITPEDGFELDKENMTVTIGDKIYGPNDGAFDIDNKGNVTIYKEYINGNIHVTCNGKTDLISVTTYTLLSTITPDKDYITGESDYTVEITKGLLGTDIDPSKHIYIKRGTNIYTYDTSIMSYEGDTSGGTLTIYKEFINGVEEGTSKDFCICCILINEFDPGSIEIFDIDISKLPEDIKIDIPEDANNQQDLDFNIKPSDETQQIIEESIEITIGENTYHVNEEIETETGTYIIEYDPETGDVTIPAGLIDGKITIDADTEERDDVITVTLGGIGATYAEDVKYYTFVGKEYEAGVTTDTPQYQDIKLNDFTISVKKKDGSTQQLKNTDDVVYYKFESNIIHVNSNALTDDVDELIIDCNPKKEPINYSVTYEYDSSKISLVTAPDIINSEEDLVVNFNNIDTNNGLIITVTSGGEEVTYDLTHNDGFNQNKTITLKKEYFKGDIVVKIEALASAITFPSFSKSNPLVLLNYDDSETFSFENSIGELEIISHVPDGCLEISKDETNKTIKFSSISDVVTDDENNYIELSNGYSSVKVYITVRHPKNRQEALDCFTLATIKGETYFPLTFNFDNQENVNDFISHLEITENMYYDINSDTGLCASYTKGENQTNYFELRGLNPHGRDYASTEKTEGHVYQNIQNVNYLNRKNKGTQTSTLAIDKIKKTLTVHNSEELFWAVEHSYRPIFTYDEASQTAKSIYEKARQIVKAETNDNMNEFKELRILYDYLTSNTSYNYYHYNYSTSYPDWLMYKSYFLEGVFLNNGIGVCDAFSKAYTLLCRIDGLKVIRSFGYTSSYSGHAWNYAYLDNAWYLVCPTWGKNLVQETSLFGNYYEVTNYDAFLVTSQFFIDNGSTFSDDAFPDTIRSTTNKYDNNLIKDTFTYEGETYEYVIKSKDEFKVLLLFLMENYKGSYNVCISFYNAEYITDDKTIQEWYGYACENSGFLGTFNADLYASKDKTYCNLVYKLKK